MRILKFLIILIVAVLIFAYPPQTVWSGTTERVSVSSDGKQANDDSEGGSLSADGRFVAFSSDSYNLVPGDTCCGDIFVHDRQTGQTTRVSVSSDGEQANSHSESSSISADGRFVAFQSKADNLVPGDTNTVCSDRFQSQYLPGPEDDVFVHDRQTGETTRVSVSSDGEQANDGSRKPSLSADGRFISFLSWADNLVPGDTNNSRDVFVHDRQTGETTRVSVSSDGEQGNMQSVNPSISSDGRFVAFESWADNLVPGDTNGLYGVDVFVHDRQTGQTTRVSVSSDGEQGNYKSVSPSISADGRFISFSSGADNLVPGDTNGEWDVFVHDRQTGQTTRVSISSDGDQGSGPGGLVLQSESTSISADGRFVAFQSWATNLVPGDTNNTRDVFVHDRYEGGLSTNVFSPSFDDTSTWTVYKDTDGKDTRVITFADGGDPGEIYKVIVRTTARDQLIYRFRGKVSGYTGCDKSDYDGQWPGYRKIELDNNAGFAKLLKMKMVRRRGSGTKNAYIGIFGSGDEGWTKTSGPADACGWLAAYGSDDAFVWDERDDMLALQTDFSDDSQPMVAMGDDSQTWIADISATASGNVFSPRFDDTSTWVVYKDTDGKDTNIITFADAGAPGEKYKVIVRTTTGDTIIYKFIGNVSGYTGCDKSAHGGEWPGYRKIVLGKNAGFATMLKMQMLRRSGSGPRYAYVGFYGSGDEGWTQTSGPADGCGW